MRELLLVYSLVVAIGEFVTDDYVVQNNLDFICGQIIAPVSATLDSKLSSRNFGVEILDCGLFTAKSCFAKIRATAYELNETLDDPYDEMQIIQNEGHFELNIMQFIHTTPGPSSEPEFTLLPRLCREIDFAA